MTAKNKATKLPEATEGTTLPEATEGTTLPEATEGTTLPEAIEGTTLPEAIEGTTPPEAIEGTTPPEVIEGTTPPETTSNAIETTAGAPGVAKVAPLPKVKPKAKAKPEGKSIATRAELVAAITDIEANNNPYGRAALLDRIESLGGKAVDLIGGGAEVELYRVYVAHPGPVQRALTLWCSAARRKLLEGDIQ